MLVKTARALRAEEPFPTPGYIWGGGGLCLLPHPTVLHGGGGGDGKLCSIAVPCAASGCLQRCGASPLGGGCTHPACPPCVGLQDGARGGERWQLPSAGGQVSFPPPPSSPPPHRAAQRAPAWPCQMGLCLRVPGGRPGPALRGSTESRARGMWPSGAEGSGEKRGVPCGGRGGGGSLGSAPPTP